MNLWHNCTFSPHHEHIPVYVNCESGHFRVNWVQKSCFYLKSNIEIVFEEVSSYYRVIKGYLLYFVVLDLPEVEDISSCPGPAHVDAEGDQAALGGEEENLPQGELFVTKIARQLHSYNNELLVV